MDSGLCYTSGIIYRGSCSDPNFKDPACSPYCQDCVYYFEIDILDHELIDTKGSKVIAAR